MHILDASSPEDFHAAIAAHPWLLVDFHKDHCPGCRMLDMSLRAFAGDPAASGLVLLRVKLEAVGAALFHALGLRQTPTLSLYREGEEAVRLAGFQTPAQIATAVGLHRAAADVA